MESFTQIVKKCILQKLDVKEVHINSVTHTVIQIVEEDKKTLPMDIIIDKYYEKYQSGEPMEKIINNIIYDYYKICMERDK